ncbi:hypothetical protein Gogos_021406 [Gossypium gossypioides]|uniref:Wound-responsive family protein n=3 Tax=Gossypium TaxID=3633 RepID=A0A7J9D187_GOSGO|nr:hypothetical protein [Gossypium gossypioides]
MSSTSRAWVVAASIGAVEALKDQGICRWNYTVRSVVQHAKNHVRSASQAKNLSSQSSAAISKGLNKSKQSEESLRTVIQGLSHSYRCSPNKCVDSVKNFSLQSRAIAAIPVIGEPESIDASQIKITVFARMSSNSRAWIVAASIGAVEALKDQGICRWNYTVRSVVQHAKNHVRSASQAKNLSSQSSAAISRGLNKSKQSEESLRTVMYLSCWGPN